MNRSSHAKSDPQVSAWPSAARPRRAELPLSCGHRVIYPAPVPEPGSTVWCQACGDGARVEPSTKDGAQ
jgi:hypothetical protein